MNLFQGRSPYGTAFFLVLAGGGCYTVAMKLLYGLLALMGAVCAAEVGKMQSVANLPQHEVVAAPAALQVGQGNPRNIILMIGDGMSSEHVWAAWVCNGGKLNITQLPVTGFSRTFSANRLITDSAAGGTALACGEKTDNGMLGQTPAGKRLSSLATTFAGAPYHKKTGLVVTKAITDATPAAFYAHVASRKNTAEIARYLCESGVDVVVGGGSAAFSEQQMQQLKSKDGSFVLLAAEGHCAYAAQRGDFLPANTRKALEVLETAPNGFFLMIEGSEIDSASHEADLRRAVEETLDFDRALGEVLKWMQHHPDTLLVVTADHQTGGLVIHDGSVKNGKVKATFASTDHTGVSVPVYAAGCGAANFTGVQDNTRIPHKILQLVQE